MSSFDLFTAAIAAKHLLVSLQPQTFEIEQTIAMLDEAIDAYTPF